MAAPVPIAQGAQGLPMQALEQALRLAVHFQNVGRIRAAAEESRADGMQRLEGNVEAVQLRLADEVRDALQGRGIS